MDEEKYTVKTDQLYAGWSSSDSESAISEYQYAIGTSSGATDMTGWISAGTDISVTKSGLSLSEGAVYYFSVKAKNEAELWSDAGYSDGITVDNTAPSTELSGVDSDSWNKASVTITLTASDSVSGADKTYYSTDCSDPATVYGGPFTLSNDGTYSIKYYSTDQAGNSESIKTADYQVKIDTTAPSTSVSGLDNSEDWYTEAVTITLTASDSVSGVGKTYYSTDGSDPALTYSSPFTFSNEGTYSIRYYSIDKAGNSETVKSAESAIKIDTASPSGSKKINNNASYTAQSDAILILSASDSSSGLSGMMFSNDNSNWSSAETYSTAKTWSLSF